jgi:hypothetical protein
MPLWKLNSFKNEQQEQKNLQQPLSSAFTIDLRPNKRKGRKMMSVSQVGIIIKIPIKDPPSWGLTFVSGSEWICNLCPGTRSSIAHVENYRMAAMKWNQSARKI